MLNATQIRERQTRQRTLAGGGAILGGLLVAGFAFLPQAIGSAGHNTRQEAVQQRARPAAIPALPLFDNLGSHRMAIGTDSPLAQRYFDQGLVFAYGFNHAEAYRAFEEAARHDRECALCYWGMALVLGPNINAGMEDADLPRARRALERALALKHRATPRERALIEALALRYPTAPVADRGAYDRDYAKAMRALIGRFPQDLDAATLLAEALMVLHPWDYWTKDGEPRPWTGEILGVLEFVLERNPDHPGANHLYIHAVEASREPDRAEAAADRLRHLAPGAGHLVHMPSHIYIRTGRYHDAVLANQRAIAADRAYRARVAAEGLYPLAYMPHNQHFLWAAATLEGNSTVAIKAARTMAAAQDPAVMRQPGWGTLQHFWSTPLYALVRFGRWSEIAATPAPADDLVYPRGVWHYAQGIAAVREQRLSAAAAHLAALAAIAQDPALADVTVWDINGTADLLAIAREVLAGELAAAKGDLLSAVRHLQIGVRLEDALNYDEPRAWHHPVRQVLGAVLMHAGRHFEAEQVYRADLEQLRDNGWSLSGLHVSLMAQGKREEAAEVAELFAAAWRHADVTLTTSRF